jgi:SNF2 family DNA or RNA helicase
MMPVQVNARHRLVGVPWSEKIKNLFPDAKALDFDGAAHLLLPHRPTETFLLRRMGYDVPAPILTHYDWCGGTPFSSQKSTAALLTLEERAYVLNGMGTGKTKSALWAWDYLRSNNVCGKLLVSAPLSTLNFTWAREIFNTLPHRKCVVLHGSKKQRLEKLAEGDAEIFIINHDGHKVILDELLARTDINVLVIDELAVFRSGSSLRTKLMQKLCDKVTWVWGMTGSPIPTSPTDAWAQARLITPSRVPKFFGRYRDELMFKSGPFGFKPKRDAVEKAFATLQPAVRFTLDDVVELPECVERTLDVEMGPKQTKIYKALVDQCYAAVQSQEITAANAGAVMMKLLQVSTGWVYDKEKNIVALDNDKRVGALIDAVNATDRKVLVFVPFKHALAGISTALTSESIEHAVVSGDTPMKERSQIFNLFQNTDKYRVIAAHPQCLAHGITLTAADTIIWFAPVTSLEIYDQANHRIRRVGQKHKQLLLHLQSTPVEKKIYRMLQGKQKIQDQLLDLFEDHTTQTAETPR